jgi:hypothetical protein
MVRPHGVEDIVPAVMMDADRPRGAGALGAKVRKLLQQRESRLDPGEVALRPGRAKEVEPVVKQALQIVVGVAADFQPRQARLFLSAS